MIDPANNSQLNNNNNKKWMDMKIKKITSQWMIKSNK